MGKVSSTSVVQSSPITEKGVFLYSSREGRGLATVNGPRYYTYFEQQLLHTCDCIHFLTAPLNQQLGTRMGVEVRECEISELAARCMSNEIKRFNALNIGAIQKRRAQRGKTNRKKRD